MATIRSKKKTQIIVKWRENPTKTDKDSDDRMVNCPWINPLDASAVTCHSAFDILPHHTYIILYRPFRFFFLSCYPLCVTVDILFHFMLSFFDRINLFQLHSFDWTAVFKSQCRVQYTDAYPLRFALSFFISPPEMFFNAIVSLYYVRCAQACACVRVCVSAIVSVCCGCCCCCFMWVGTHHYASTNWKCWKRVLYHYYCYCY